MTAAPAERPRPDHAGGPVSLPALESASVQGDSTNVRGRRLPGAPGSASLPDESDESEEPEDPGNPEEPDDPAKALPSPGVARRTAGLLAGCGTALIALLYFTVSGTVLGPLLLWPRTATAPSSR